MEESYVHPFPIPHLFVMHPPPLLLTTIPTFHYIPDVQLCRECAISEAKFPSLWKGAASLTTTITCASFEVPSGREGCCVVQFPFLRHSTNSLVQFSKSEQGWQTGWNRRRKRRRRRRRIFIYVGIYLVIINFTCAYNRRRAWGGGGLVYLYQQSA